MTEELPKVNQVYNYFDDGKIHNGRLYKTTINEIVKFDDIDEQTLTQWKDEVHQCYWLYHKVTDFFIKATIESIDEQIVFVRTINDGWFSLGNWAGRLDLDGKILEALNERN